MPLPTAVDERTSSFLAAIDDGSPDLVEGLYLHGSLGFGEWFAHTSDVDYVAVLRGRPGQEDVEALREVHAAMAGDRGAPHFDGFHVVASDLAHRPMLCPTVPGTQAGAFREHCRFDVNPVTWHELAWHGITVRGPDLGAVDLWTDATALREYTRGNLATYWLSSARSMAQHSPAELPEEIVAWCVLGVTRLHHLLRTGRLTSKSGAGRYALEEFDARWRRVIGEALRIREVDGSEARYDDPADRGRDASEFTAMVVRAGLAI